MALNAPIQAASADIIKVAMLRVHGALTTAKLRSRMLLQVHDELVLEIAEGERAAVQELVCAEMGAAHQTVRAAGGVGRCRAQLGRRGALASLVSGCPHHSGAGAFVPVLVRGPAAGRLTDQVAS